MRLKDDEKAMLEGGEGKARQKAMELLVRYGEALGAECLIDTNNVCGANVFTNRQSRLAHPDYKNQDAVFSEFSLDSEEELEIPSVRAFSCQLIGPMDRDNWQLQGLSQEEHDSILESESYSARHGIHLMSTCTPYQVGNVPVKGEHCAWMESSAVVYINSVLGARTNVEGRESSAAAMMTGKIPYWGYHLDENRLATHVVHVECEVVSTMDWGLLGYYIGQVVDDRVPVIRGIGHTPDLVKLKHFGAAAASSGGVEMYHIPGITPEASSAEEALGGRRPIAEFSYGTKERRMVYEALNSTASDPQVDLVMIGCPHASIEQIREVCTLLEDTHVHENCHLWVFTPDPIRRLAERNGYAAILRGAGAVLMSDTCPAIGRFLPKGTKVVATDSAKQVHYLPAIMGVQGWFGSVQECVQAAITRKWSGGI